MVKNPPAKSADLRDMGSISGSGRYLQKGMATHSSILPGESHGERNLSMTGRLQSQRVRHART